MIAEPIGFKHEQQEKEVPVKKLQKASQLRCFFHVSAAFPFSPKVNVIFCTKICKKC